VNGKRGSPPIGFRPMREADLPAVLEIERAAFSHPWSEEMIRRELLHEFSNVLLATEGLDGPILGFAVVWLVHDELQILNVAVAAEARRRGVARRILDRVEGSARERGARVAMLEVRGSNLPAISLYRSLGDREVGVRPRYYAQDGEDALAMDKEL